MIKKLLLMVALVSSLFSAEPILTIYDANQEGDVIIDYHTAKNKSAHVSQDSRDWVGVYKKGASNAWKNVLQWKWAKNMYDARERNSVEMNLVNLPVGEYDVRYFLDNSYITYASHTVTILDANNEDAFIDIYYVENGGRIEYTASFQGTKSWVGIYKKGASNAWKNVLGWKWAWSNRELMSMRLPKLSKGDYEARLFYNNSYKLEAKASFSIEDEIIEPEISFAQQHDGVFIFVTTTSGKGNKDWVGLYKVGDSNSWNNVLAWSWVDVEDEGYGKSFDVNLIPSGEYELRLFYHNSYKVEAVKNVHVDYN